MRRHEGEVGETAGPTEKRVCAVSIKDSGKLGRSSADCKRAHSRTPCTECAIKRQPGGTATQTGLGVGDLRDPRDQRVECPVRALGRPGVPVDACRIPNSREPPRRPSRLARRARPGVLGHLAPGHLMSQNQAHAALGARVLT